MRRIRRIWSEFLVFLAMWFGGAERIMLGTGGYYGMQFVLIKVFEIGRISFAKSCVMIRWRMI
jgi:hypothetical protein